jgi:thiamine-monophosphate kinase
MSWSEARLHAWLARRAPARALLGAAQHDAAILRPGAQGAPLAWCVDQVAEGVHFEAGTPARLIGRKAVDRACSDLAASAARPRALLLALSAGQDKSEAWMRAVIASAAARARALGAELVGGDLCARPGPALLSVSAYGELDQRQRAPARAHARAGELVLLSGPVGGSLLGRHLRIEPRIALGRALAAAGARALMDVSDGLAIDLARIARTARVRIELELELVPVHRDAQRRARASGQSALTHALVDGEDHELLATMTPALWRAHGARLRKLAPRLGCIGRVSAGAGLVLLGGSARERAAARRGGWVHGRTRGAQRER